MAIFLYRPESQSDAIAAIEKRIRAAVPNLTRVAAIGDFARRPADTAATDYLLVAALEADATLLSQVADAATLCRDNGFVILISAEISASDYKRLLRTGAAEWVAMNGVPRDILEIMTRRESAVRVKRPAPIVASFVPAAGGVGNTTLAVETAVMLKTAGAKRNICFVDLDFQNSHASDYLDIEPRLKILEISNNPERLDHQLLDIYVSRHPCGLHVFAAPRSKLDVCELALSALEALFNQISLRYDIIIIDLPVTWFAWTRQIIAGSDGVVLTGLNTIPGLRQLADTAAAIRDAGMASTALAIVLNRCERGPFGHIARQHHFKKVLSQETVFLVRAEPQLVESANTGVPLAIGGGARKTRNEIAAVAQFCESLRSRRAAASDAASVRIDGAPGLDSNDEADGVSRVRNKQS